MTAPGALTNHSWTSDPAPDDLRLIIDEELARLPEKYRAPVLLCDLGGRSIDEAAGVLKWPRGTVGTRLTKARSILKTRLARRGLGLGAGLTVIQASADPVSAAWINQTAHSATLYATSGTTTAGTTPAAVLATQILWEMTMSKMKLSAAVLIVGLTLGGISLVALRAESGRGTIAAPLGADDPKSKTDRDRLHQSWVLTTATTNGKTSVITEDLMRSSWVFQGDTVVVKTKRGPEMTFTVSLDPSKSPKTMRLESTKPDKGRNLTAIYVLTDETLKLGWIESGDNAIPADFETAPQPPALLAVVELVPEKKVPKADAPAVVEQEEAMAKSEANRNLKMIGLAMHDYHSATTISRPRQSARPTASRS